MSLPKLGRRLSQFSREEVWQWFNRLDLSPNCLEIASEVRPSGNEIFDFLKTAKLKAAEKHKIRKAVKNFRRQHRKKQKDRLHRLRPWEPGYSVTKEEKSQGGCFPSCILSPKAKGIVSKKRVGLVYDKACMAHLRYDSEEQNNKKSTVSHSETPDRIKVINDYFNTAKFGDLFIKMLPRPATKHEISYVHSSDHIHRLWKMNETLRKLKQPVLRFGDDTPYTAGSFNSILLSCGGVLKAVEKVLNGTLESAYTFLRPPGHHAERSKCMGFCFVNNIAVAAEMARKKFGITRIAIVDWDVHWGNATQKMYYNDPEVFYISIHRYDSGKFYPGEKEASEGYIGESRGRGRNMNFPLYRGMGDEVYMAIFDLYIEPVLRDFNPELILVSAGFDSALGDMGKMNVTEPCYCYMTERLKAICPQIVLILEGGYNLKVLPRCSYAAATALLWHKPRHPTREGYLIEGKSVYGDRIEVEAGTDTIVIERLLRLWDSLQPYYPSLQRPRRSDFVEELYTLWPKKYLDKDVSYFFKRFPLLSAPFYSAPSLPGSSSGYFRDDLSQSSFTRSPSSLSQVSLSHSHNCRIPLPQINETSFSRSKLSGRKGTTCPLRGAVIVRREYSKSISSPSAQRVSKPRVRSCTVPLRGSTVIKGDSVSQRVV